VADDTWGSVTVIGLLVIGVCFLILMVGYELDHHAPLMEFRLFRIPQFLIGNMIGWISTVALFGAEFLMPLYLQNLRGLDAFHAGLLLLPQGVSTGIVGPISGRLTDRFGVRLVTVFGFILLAYNTWGLTHLTPYTTYGEIQLLLIIRGAALGFTVQSGNLVALNAVPGRLVTNASSLFTAARNVVQSLGVAFLGAVQQTGTVSHTELLRQGITPDSPGGLFIQQAAANALHAAPGLSQATAQATGSYFLLAQIQQQAASLAFGDAYRLTFYAALLAIGVSLLLPSRMAKQEGAGAMAA
jgi:DHA2 family multidrug resistance protein